MLSIGDVQGKRYVLARNITGEVLLAAPVGENKVRSVDWVDEDHALVTVSATTHGIFDPVERIELFFVMSIDIQKKTSFILFDHNSKFMAFNGGVLAAYVIGGRPYAFVSNVPKEGIGLGSHLDTGATSYFTRNYPDLWKIDVGTGSVELAAHGTDTISNWAISPDGALVAHALYDPSTTTWALFHGNLELMRRTSPRRQTHLVGLGRTPDTVLVLDGSDDTQHALEVGPDGKAEALLDNEPVTGWLHDSNNGLLIGAILNQTNYKFFDPARQARVDAAVKPFAGLNKSIQSVNAAVDKVIIHTTGDRDSGTYWLVDLKAHKADIIDNDYPGVPADQVGEVRRIEYKASDGLELDGILTLPPGRTAKNLPLVMLPHGGPIGIHDEVWFDWIAQAFAARGYAVFQPNYRGSSGRGSAFQQAGFGEFGRKMLSDMSDGMAVLARDGIVDPKRACIVGFSYGGYAAMAGVTVQQGLYRCAVAGSGISDLPRFVVWNEDKAGRGNSSVKFWKEAMGVTVPGAPPLVSISPAMLAARADAPMLLIHGRDDSVVPLEQSEKMERAMKAAGKPVQLIIIAGEDHWLSHEASRVETLKAAVEFVEKNNPVN